jgi:hypothetical protein
MTPEIVQIDTTKPNFDAILLSVEEASAKHNILGGKSYCRCQKLCALVPKCSCFALGKLCRDKCHGGSKNMKKFKCSNCVPLSTLTQVGSMVEPNMRRAEVSRKCKRDIYLCMSILCSSNKI